MTRQRVKPLHWGSWKGRIIEAIVRNGQLRWDELLELTGLDEKSLKKALAELFDLAQIEKNEGKYRVCYEIYEEYSNFLGKQKTSEEPSTKGTTQRIFRKHSGLDKTEFIDWINQWREVEKISFSLEPKHFFLEDRHLDAFSKGLISDSKSEVLVVNPFIEKCDLSETLREAKERGIEVKVLTRPPDDRNEQHRQRREEYHSILKDEGIRLYYNNEAHAKLVVVDRAVAIVSSMNFYSGSSGGRSWEAGLISIEDTVVTSVANAILELLKKPESKELK
jgi:hypothetical protein